MISKLSLCDYKACLNSVFVKLDLESSLAIVSASLKLKEAAVLPWWDIVVASLNTLGKICF